jgi:predicted RNase H-like nuclease (RuvC/YqgF family)
MNPGHGGEMNTVLQTVDSGTADRLRDVQRETDQKVVDELNEKISKLESKLEELKTENQGLEAWLKSEKRTYRLQYYGSGGRM